MKYSTFFFVFVSFSLFSQDTVRVMHYNVLNYGGSGSVCDDLATKNANLKKVIKYAKPDIFAVNELVTNMQGGQNTIAKSILDNVMNSDGVTYFKRAFDTGIGSQVNMLYYNSNLFELYDQESIIDDVNGNALVRYIDVYRLFYKGNLPDTDTMFIDHFVAHLKASNTPQDIADRALETEAVMNYIETNPVKGNRIFSGDFNVKSSNEEAFQNLINHPNTTLRFFDPINALGDWNNDANFKSVHTQSTHVSGSCFSSGGMDDRFDFIMLSAPMMNSQGGFTYINNSYRAIGQDGNMFNQDLTIIGNGDVDATIAQAMFDISDHLPVYLELYADASSIGIQENSSNKDFFSLKNPSDEHILLFPNNILKGSYMIQLSDLQGRILSSQVIEYNNESLLEINNINNLKSGIYILSISLMHAKNTASQVLKMIKK